MNSKPDCCICHLVIKGDSYTSFKRNGKMKLRLWSRGKNRMHKLCAERKIKEMNSVLEIRPQKKRTVSLNEAFQEAVRIYPKLKDNEHEPASLDWYFKRALEKDKSINLLDFATKYARDRMDYRYSNHLPEWKIAPVRSAIDKLINGLAQSLNFGHEGTCEKHRIKIIREIWSYCVAISATDGTCDCNVISISSKRAQKIEALCKNPR